MEEDKSFGLFVAYKFLEAVKECAKERGIQWHEQALEANPASAARAFACGKGLAYADMEGVIQDLIDTLKEAEVKQ